MRISRILLVTLLGIALVPLAVASVLLLGTSKESLRTALFERHLEKATALSHEVERHLQSLSSELQDYGALVEVAKMDERQQTDLVRFILGKRRSALNIVTLWVGNGRKPAAAAFLKHPKGATARQAHEAEAQRLWDAADQGSAPAHNRLGPDVYISDVYRVEVDNRPAVTLAVRWVDNGTPIMLAAELNIQPIQAQVARAREDTTIAYLIDNRGTVLAHPDTTRVDARAHMLPEELENQQARVVSGTQVFRTPEGDRLLGAWAPIRGVGWTVIVAQPEKDALSSLTRMSRTIILIAVISILCAMLVAIYMARSMSRPLNQVVQAALEIARGKFGARAHVRTRNEIGDLAHTFNYMSTQLAEYDVERTKLYEDLERGYLETIRALANSIDAKDAYTRGHSQRVTDLSVETAKELGLNGRDLKIVQFGAILHDIGKIGIKDSVLRKAAPLTDEEYEYMKTHPMLGVGIIDPIDFLRSAKSVVRSHHERYDGKGYPDGLAGDDIPLPAMIVNIADAYDAMVTQRPYNKPMTFDQAVARLKEIAGTQHDPHVTEAFLRVLFKRRAEEEVGGVWRSARSAEAHISESPDGAPSGDDPGRGTVPGRPPEIREGEDEDPDIPVPSSDKVH